MKKLLSMTLIGTTFFLGSNSARADWDTWGFSYNYDIPGTDDVNLKIYTIDSSTGTKTLRSQKNIGHKASGNSFGDGDSYVKGNKIYIETTENSGNKLFNIYDLDSDTWSTSSDTSHWSDGLTDTQKKVGIFNYGDTTMEITSEGITKDGENIIKTSSDGITSIGKNSFKLQETETEMKLWATDSNGRIAPINITNGTKLLIDGRDVEQSINNVGALSAALTGLPTVPTDTTLACGLGTGTHGGDFAFSGGCASKVNEKLSINYAASMTMPGQDYAGDFEDTFSARAGLVWKLGKSVKPNLVSMKENQKLTNEITDLKSENKKLNKKITKFETEKLELLARLERLEKIALSESKSKDLATIKLP